jgi:hypothetical protein
MMTQPKFDGCKRSRVALKDFSTALRVVVTRNPRRREGGQKEGGTGPAFSRKVPRETQRYFEKLATASASVL